VRFWSLTFLVIPPPLSDLESFCERHGLPLILDAAHAFGTSYQGKPAGSHGKIHVFSTSATKLLCTGEGGIVATHDSALAKVLESMREYGHAENYETHYQGLNGRMSEFQGALGIEALALLEEHAKRRNKIAEGYKKALSHLPIAFQEIEPQSRSSYKDFAILLLDDWVISRDDVSSTLESEGIPNRKYFSPPLHQQEFFLRYASRSQTLPNTERICQRILCLPIFYDLKESQIEQIAQVLTRIFHQQKTTVGQQ